MQAVTITQISIYELKDIIEDCMFKSLYKHKNNDIIKLELKIKELENLIKLSKSKNKNYEPKQTNCRLPKQR
jgi:triacylglycerol esterase/lipase EstA (alpha/beta hydrolase family)